MNVDARALDQLKIRAAFALAIRTGIRAMVKCGAQIHRQSLVPPSSDTGAVRCAGDALQDAMVVCTDDDFSRLFKHLDVNRHSCTRASTNAEAERLYSHARLADAGWNLYNAIAGAWSDRSSSSLAAAMHRFAEAVEHEEGLPGVAIIDSHAREDYRGIEGKWKRGMLTFTREGKLGKLFSMEMLYEHLWD